MEGAHQVAAFRGRDRRDVFLPAIRIHGRRTLLVEPVELGLAQHEDAAQHQFADAVRVRLGVGEGERRAPGAAEYLPALDAERLAQALDVRDEIPGRVVLETRVRTATPAAALVEEENSVARRIEESARAGIATGARPAVQEHDRLACRIAAFLPIDLVAVADGEMTLSSRLDRRIEAASLAR